jgi:CopG family nickel-responsive transcriptional regulator
MQRVTITLDDALMAQLDALIEARGYQNRSEAIRDLARAGLQQTATGAAAGQRCVAALVYVYDHGVRELAKRLNHAFHDHHDMAVSTLHVHLDHDSCMEVTVLKGLAGAVARFAEQVIAERGVKHGRLVIVPVEVASELHVHGEQASHPHEHVHVR